MVWCFFLLIHISVIEDYELPKSTSHILSAPKLWNVSEFYLDPSLFFFYFNCLPVYVLCKIITWQTIRLVATSWDNLWVVISSEKYKNAMPDISENAILHPVIYWYLGSYSVFKTKNINSLIFVNTIIK